MVVESLAEASRQRTVIFLTRWAASRTPHCAPRRPFGSLVKPGRPQPFARR
jgi:hypothetical protein